MPTSRHPQKRCPSSPGPARPRPLVAPGDPPRRHTPRPAAHPACPRHRLVMLATRPPSQCTTFASEATDATVMLQCPLAAAFLGTPGPPRVPWHLMRPVRVHPYGTDVRYA